MTRDECICAISDVFGGVYTWAVEGFWNIHIETVPKRQLILSDWFVRRNIKREGLTTEEFKEILKSIKDDEWAKEKDGSLMKSFGFPSNVASVAK